MIAETLIECATAAFLGCVWLADRVVRRATPPAKDVGDPVLVQRAALMDELRFLHARVRDPKAWTQHKEAQMRIAEVSQQVQAIDAARRKPHPFTAEES